MEAKRQVEDVFEAEAQIAELVRLRLEGEPSRMEEAREIAREWGLNEKEVIDRFAEAELALEELRPEKVTEAEIFFGPSTTRS